MSYYDDLAEWYIRESWSNRWPESTIENGKTAVEQYNRHLDLGMRPGQAFVLELTTKDQEKIVGTNYDPYHSPDLYDLVKAIEFLVDQCDSSQDTHAS